MTGLDTNVLVRYLTEDDKAQAQRAARCISRATARGGRCYISPIVLCELVWVLHDAYDHARSEALARRPRLAFAGAPQVPWLEMVLQYLASLRRLCPS